MISKHRPGYWLKISLLVLLTISLFVLITHKHDAASPVNKCYACVFSLTLTLPAAIAVIHPFFIQLGTTDPKTSDTPSTSQNYCSNQHRGPPALLDAAI